MKCNPRENNPKPILQNSPQGKGKKGGDKGKGKGKGGGGGWVKLRGLPFDSTEADVVHFFGYDFKIFVRKVEYLTWVS
jgi:hypothetical protein